ncbi:MAG: ABC transporter ATP-binding protein [Bacteroidetes bacterium RIFCSPHIGHO2_02_FULL_44_7]|nr:MAG: ABC transporter ATP-binding protein [Bacteroidetes bacterium RIFCSPHIGHO2_02_FULL_44_7]
MIKVVSLNKSYGKKKILENVHLSFEPGKVYGVVGKNGAGKTTLFKCLLGLEHYEGTVESTFGSLKNTTGYLPTDPYFLSYLTGKEYLQLMCNARDIKISSFTHKNIFNLPLHQYASTYSTGMKKKLALTGILLQKNEVFILDEPNNGVDIESNILISAVIQRLKELNKTVILSSHIFSTLEENCDTLYYIKSGSVSEPIGKGHFSEVQAQLTGDEHGISLKDFDF